MRRSYIRGSAGKCGIQTATGDTIDFLSPKRDLLAPRDGRQVVDRPLAGAPRRAQTDVAALDGIYGSGLREKFDLS